MATARAKPDSALAAALRQLRIDRGRSQEDVAHAAGLTVTALARIERGQTNPAWTTVRRVATALDVSLTELARAVDERG